MRKKDSVYYELVCCVDCPACVFDDNEIPERWGEYWCRRLDEKVDPEKITGSCPLPTIQELQLA